ncbi:septal ring lytic transglycosylase RlpA family protein [Hyphomonas sp. WL0036]|uniref:septal ring lytic transglycosylase RlpA family protein n=1 Tax=Hyphomonas sediminis TaxID=2866160 RepID=UPI001C808372|nr:septal ring lytic transglycosylase RlpA family protein [Hyphomonas sediminis]MBY9067619.1 septal ring lytic transglycosylase RlpA family protein [Hyphomonas sediminis]
MPSKRPTLVSRSKVAISVIALACAVSAVAEAGSRAAPIVFKGDNVTAAAPVRYVQAPSAPAPQAKAAPVDKARARIEFRYPDSQLAGGEYVPASAGPVSAAPVARESAVIEAPQVILPSKPVVEASSLQSMPEPAGQGMGYTPLTPAPQPIAAGPAVGEFVETGVAVVYGQEFSGLPTANGELFSQAEMTAAHPSLPLPSLVYVTNLDTGREVVVRVNDRGPFEDGANLQLSQKAAEALGMSPAGKGNVQLRYLSTAPVLATQPVAQRPAPLTPAAKAPEFQPVKAQMASVAMPVEDELLGGGATSAATPAPRLMSMTLAPQAATYSAPVAASGDVFVQLASFSDIGNAEAMLRKVERELPVEIVPARVNGADFFRVRVGPFDGHDAAERVRARLSANGTAEGRIVSGS